MNPMEGILSNPLIFSTAFPLLVSFSIIVAIKLVLGNERGGEFAGLGVGIGFLLAYIFIVGRPPFPPIASSHKLFYLAVIGFGVGLFLDRSKSQHHVKRTAAIGFPMLTAYWFGYSQFHGLALSPEVLKFLVITIVGGILMARLDKLADRGLTSSIMILFAAIGLSGVAMFSNTQTLSQLGITLGGSMVGFILWNWPKTRFPFNGVLLLGAGGLLMVMLSQAIYFTKIPPLTLLLLVPIFFSDIVVKKFIAGNDRVATRLKPIVLGLIASIPTAAAIAVAAHLN
ncbi:MAG: hypothetical protein OQJ97_12265 [Rhodospirillales bacterium]|nr:hypothetical protein [Rhodospirillales bacterium]